ncbi:unnamed protein product, partial [Ascophyllum nodosum]
INGLLGLREFIVGVWNYCSYDTKLIAKLLFDIFDVDRRGIITMAELDAMLRMLYASREADPDLLQLLAINGSGDEDTLTFDEFLQAVKENNQVVQPAFKLQEAIRRKVLGVNYWERKARQRLKRFPFPTPGKMTSVQAVEAIISIKKRERAQERERQKRDLAVKHDEDLKQAFEDNRAIYEDQQVRKIRKLDELRGGRSEEEVREEEAWKALRQAREVMAINYNENNVDRLRAAREMLWDCYERAIAASKASTTLRARRELELALKDDAKCKADAWILTKQGKMKYDFLCRQTYGNLLHRDYVGRGPPMNAFAALHAQDEAPVTLATNIAYSNPRNAMLVEAKAIARRKVIERFAKQEAAEASARAMHQVARQEEDFSALYQQLVDEAGASGTSWDLVGDPNTDVLYYLHVEDDGSVTRYPKDTAVCHNCDAMIDLEDRICYRCNTVRSKKVR